MRALPFLFNVLVQKLWAFKNGFSVSFASTPLTAAVETILLSFD